MTQICFFFSSRRRHTRLQGDWSSDVCSSDLPGRVIGTDLVNPDFPALARAYGGFGERVEQTADFEAAFERRSEERRVGKECRAGWGRGHEQRKERDERQA